jgi:phenylacetic acid degradation operon negative regulatory protein
VNREILAEELLLLMTYSLDLLAMPTFRKWDQSYEGWLYQNGLLHRFQYLEAKKYIERRDKGKEWVFRVTDSGRRFLARDRDPEVEWSRKWDGLWRMFVFDLPTPRHKERSSLIRWLRRNGFGYLQDSVWISPHAVPDLAQKLKRVREDAEMCSVLECRPAAGFSDKALVNGAWPFGEIGKRQRAYREFAENAIRTLRAGRVHPRDLFTLLHTERRQWSEALEFDPLLPIALWPGDYEGQRAWQLRKDLLRLAAAQVS